MVFTIFSFIYCHLRFSNKNHFTNLLNSLIIIIIISNSSCILICNILILATPGG